MVWLGMLYGVCAASAPLIALTTLRSVVICRASGAERGRAVRGASSLLLLGAVWGASSLAIALASARGPLGWPPPLTWAEWALLLAPLACAWLPGAAALVLALPSARGRGEAPPRWARWLDLLWAG